MDTYGTSIMPMCTHATTWNLSTKHLPTLTHGQTHQQTNTTTLYFYTRGKNFVAYTTPISGQSQVD